MYAAQRKLICDNPEHFPSRHPDKRNLQVLAVHSTRFILNLTSTGVANQMAVDSVRGHLRVLTDYNALTRMLKSEVLSEPILAIAAGDILLKSKATYRTAVETLVDQLLVHKKVISVGENGETYGRIILIVNRDATVHAAGGQICVVDPAKREIVNQPSIQQSNLRYAVRPFLLKSYLHQLVDGKKLAQDDGAYDSGMKWASDVHMNFTHFIQLEDTIESYLSYEFVLLCWRRGLALQCVHGQPVIDNLLIGYKGKLHKAFDPKMFIFVAVQVKNRASAAKLDLINSITCPFLNTDSDRWKPQYMAILMDLGTSTNFQGTQGHVKVTQCKAARGQTSWSAFSKTDKYSAVRISIRGCQPYLSLHEWAPAILNLESKMGLTDFSSFNEEFESMGNPTKNTLTLTTNQTSKHYNKLFMGT
jgi:hypothetical protein